jgi:hypothetical protein
MKSEVYPSAPSISYIIEPLLLLQHRLYPALVFQNHYHPLLIGCKTTASLSFDSGIGIQWKSCVRMLLTLTSTLYFRWYVLVLTSKRIIVSIRNRRILHPLAGLSPNILAVDSLDPGHETIRSSTHPRRGPNSITGLHPAGMRNPVRCCGSGFGCYRSLFSQRQVRELAFTFTGEAIPKPAYSS